MQAEAEGAPLLPDRKNELPALPAKFGQKAPLAPLPTLAPKDTVTTPLLPITTPGADDGVTPIGDKPVPLPVLPSLPDKEEDPGAETALSGKSDEDKVLETAQGRNPVLGTDSGRSHPNLFAAAAPPSPKQGSQAPDLEVEPPKERRRRRSGR